MNKLILVLSLSMLCFAGVASSQVTFPELNHGRVVYQQTIAKQEYRIALSNLRKVNSVFRASREERLFASLRRQTIEIREQVSHDEIWLRIVNDTNTQAGIKLFECQGLDCGSSNAWANTRFNIKQLYGLDASQRYAVWSFNSQPFQYLVAYLVQRGNKRTYIQLDLVTPIQSEKPIVALGEIVGALNTQGFFVVSDLSYGGSDTLDVNPELLKRLAQAIRNIGSRHFVLVGHDTQISPPDLAQANSKRLVNDFKILLEQQLGDSPKTIAVEFLGGLAPEGKQKGLSVVILAK